MAKHRYVRRKPFPYYDRSTAPDFSLPPLAPHRPAVEVPAVIVPPKLDPLAVRTLKQAALKRIEQGGLTRPELLRLGECVARCNRQLSQ